jgi:hypothetical protein
MKGKVLPGVEGGQTGEKGFGVERATRPGGTVDGTKESRTEQVEGSGWSRWSVGTSQASGPTTFAASSHRPGRCCEI